MWWVIDVTMSAIPGDDRVTHLVTSLHYASPVSTPLSSILLTVFPFATRQRQGEGPLYDDVLLKTPHGAWTLDKLLKTNRTYGGTQLTTFAQTTPTPHQHHTFWKKLWCGCGVATLRWHTTDNHRPNHTHTTPTPQPHHTTPTPHQHHTNTTPKPQLFHKVWCRCGVVGNWLQNADYVNSQLLGLSGVYERPIQPAHRSAPAHATSRSCSAHMLWLLELQRMWARCGDWGRLWRAL